MIRSFAFCTALCLALTVAASAAHVWTVQSATTGASGRVDVSENYLTTGAPWDSDGIPDCPPVGADDVRCAWLAHTGGDAAHAMNGVLATTLDGSAAQNVVFLSDVWSDPLSSPSTWLVKYDVHFLAVDPADIATLRTIMRFQHSGTTFLTLSLNGQVTTSHLQFTVAPTHVWTDTPETGANWRIQLTLSRTIAGSPAMIWIDNIKVTESTSTHYDEPFPLKTGDLNGDGAVNGMDLGSLLAAWGRCPAPPAPCAADLDHNGVVNGLDLATLLAAWTG